MAMLQDGLHDVMSKVVAAQVLASKMRLNQKEHKKSTDEHAPPSLHSQRSHRSVSGMKWSHVTASI